MKHKVGILFLCILLLVSFTGCVYSNTRTSIKNDGSGQISVVVGVSENVYSEAFTLGKKYKGSINLDSLKPIEVNGKTIYGETTSVSFTSLDDFNTKMKNVLSYLNKNNVIDITQMQMSWTNNHCMKLVVNICPTVASEVGSKYKSYENDNNAYLESTVDDIQIVFNFEFPEKVRALSTSKAGVITSGNNLSLNITSMSDKLNQNKIYSYSFVTDKVEEVLATYEDLDYGTSGLTPIETLTPVQEVYIPAVESPVVNPSTVIETAPTPTPVEQKEDKSETLQQVTEIKENSEEAETPNEEVIEQAETPNEEVTEQVETSNEEVTEQVAVSSEETVEGQNVSNASEEKLEEETPTSVIEEQLVVEEIEEPTRFSDVKRSAWYYPAVEAMASGSLILGYSDKTFKPDNRVTYTDFCTILSKFARIADTSGDYEYWAGNAIKGCLNYNIIPNRGALTAENYEVPMTREEIVSAMARTYVCLKGNENSGYDANKIKDYSEVSNNFKSDIVFAYAVGITNGYEDGTFNPKGEVTRAQLCQLFFNLNWTKVGGGIFTSF